MRKDEKQQVVAELEEALREWQHLIVCGYRGLSVKAMAQLRRAIREAGGQLRVVKKTLFQRALGEGHESGLTQYMEGPVAVAFASRDPLAVLKEMSAFARTHEQLDLKGGWVDGQLLGGGQLAELATLPPREELLGRLLTALTAPVAQLAAVLEAVPRDLVLTLHALAQQREGERGEPAGA